MKKALAAFWLVGVLAGVVGLAQSPTYYLTGNLRDVTGTVVTDQGSQRASFFGTIGFKVVPSEKGLLFTLVDLSLVSKGVPTGRGETGMLSLNLIDDDITWYDPKTGRASSEPSLVLHYELIDRIKGFRQVRGQAEGDVFAPFTETMAAKMSARFPEALKVADRGATYVDLGLTMELTTSVLGSIRRLSLNTRVGIEWWLRRPAQYLRIQPVFIGTGPNDPTRTGTAWATLMARAHELWDRCGTVRCIKFVVNAPIYINKPAYKVLETDAEATNLRAEVSVANAVEVFVVSRMDFVCSWGGGACFSSGTASAKIVTCDQQLAVPAPCPCPGYCPATCPPCPPCQTGAVNYYHLAHELGHALNLAHPPGPDGSLAASTVASNMEPSGFCCDNPNVQSAKNCRNASNPLLYWGRAFCTGKPNIMD